MNDFQTVTQIIQRRRSIFPASYVPREIPDEVIQQIIENANYAPTHKLTEPWRFVVIKGNSKLKLGEELGRIYKQTIPQEKFLTKKYLSFAEKTKQAACILAINIKFHPEQVPAWEEIAATACAVQNIALTAESLNVGGYWSSPPLIAHLNEFLELADDEKCYGLFYMGYHEEAARTAKRNPIAEKVKWMR